MGKTVVAAVLARTLAAEGKRVAVFKPAVTGLDEPGEADHELLRRASGSGQSDDRDRALPLRPARLAAPGGGASRRGDRAVAPARGSARRCARTPTCWSARASAACWSHSRGALTPGDNAPYLVRDLAADLGYPLVVAASPGLGTINHTLLTIEAARGAGLEVASVVLTPWPGDPSAIELSNRETIAALGQVEVQTLPPLDLAAPDDLAGTQLATMTSRLEPESSTS